MWKNYDELEASMSLPELFLTLDAARQQEHRNREFLAALHDRELNSPETKPAPTYEDIKARVFSGGKAKDSNDILGLVGPSATEAGIGIGKGINYAAPDSNSDWWSNL
jgi:hypothetical protein